MIIGYDITHALMALVSSGKWEINGDQIYENIIWYKSNEEELPSKELVEEKMIELKALHDSLLYKQKRKKEYPSIEECIHAILDNDLEALQAKRKDVKDKYPKPEAPSE